MCNFTSGHAFGMDEWNWYQLLMSSFLGALLQCASCSETDQLQLVFQNPVLHLMK